MAMANNAHEPGNINAFEPDVEQRYEKRDDRGKSWSAAARHKSLRVGKSCKQQRTNRKNEIHCARWAPIWSQLYPRVVHRSSRCAGSQRTRTRAGRTCNGRNGKTRVRGCWCESDDSGEEERRKRRSDWNTKSESRNFEDSVVSIEPTEKTAKDKDMPPYGVLLGACQLRCQVETVHTSAPRRIRRSCRVFGVGHLLINCVNFLSLLAHLGLIQCSMTRTCRPPETVHCTHAQRTIRTVRGTLGSAALGWILANSSNTPVPSSLERSCAAQSSHSRDAKAQHAEH